MNVLFILDTGNLNTCETGYAKQYEHFCLLNTWSILTNIYQLTVHASGACRDVAYEMKLILDPSLPAVWLAIYFSTITSRWNCQCCAVYKSQNDWQLKWLLSTNKKVTRFQVKWVVGKTLIATAPREYEESLFVWNVHTSCMRTTGVGECCTHWKCHDQMVLMDNDIS